MINRSGRYRCPLASWRFFVTGLAFVGGRNMRPTAAASDAAIMATETACADGRMINRGSRPLVGVMTGIAFLIGRYGYVIVSRACGNGSIVTT